MTTARRREDDPSCRCRRNELLGSLFAQRYQRLYHFVLARVRDADDAAEIAQQAFTEALQSYEDFRGDSEIHTWLYSIALNLTRNYLSRSPRRRYQFDGEEVLAEHPAQHADPLDQLDAQQCITMLQRHLGQLPQEMRETLLYVTLDDNSYGEAAQAFAVPVGTVRSRVSRARSILRHQLSQDGLALQAA